MDQLIDEALRDFNTFGHVSNVQLLFSLLLSLGLNAVLAKAYMYTHRGCGDPSDLLHLD